jgi:hypothetical protein
MSIEINENLLAMWYYPISEDSDWLGALSKKEDDSGYDFLYRHRYYKDDKTGPDSEDEKNWYRGTLKAEVNKSDEDVIQEMRGAVDVIAAVLGAEVTEIRMVDGDVEAFVEELKSQPFSHMSQVH